MKFKVPGPLRTLALTWAMVSLCGVAAAAFAIVQWLTASGWHVLLTSALLGAIVSAVVAVKQRQERYPIRLMPPPPPPARPSPRRSRPASRPASPSARPPSAVGEIVYYAGRRIGNMTPDGRVQLDQDSHRAG